MRNHVQDRQPDIAQEFVQESRKIIEFLHPAILKLGQGGPPGECWEILACSFTDCPRYGKNYDLPCWLHVGHIGEGLRLCPQADSEQVCRSCKVFWVINGDGRIISAAFRFFHAMKGCADFLQLRQISDVASSAEVLLDLILTGKIKLEPQHVMFLSQACDFAKAALRQVGGKYSNKLLAGPASTISCQLVQSSHDALAKMQILKARLMPLDYH